MIYEGLTAGMFKKYKIKLRSPLIEKYDNVPSVRITDIGTSLTLVWRYALGSSHFLLIPYVP